MSDSTSLDRLALRATVHCFTGCSIGEVLGMVIGTAAGLGTTRTIFLSIALAFVFGYALTILPLRGAGIGLARAIPLAFAADTLSIAAMEVIDNALMLLIPGAMDAELGDPLFWGSLALSLVVAGVAIYPVNRWMIGRGRGHAVVHAGHHGPGRGRDHAGHGDHHGSHH